jgi:hypothetical protein
MALGARPANIRQHFLREGLRSGMVGLALGLVAAAVTQKWVATMLYQAQTFDAATLAASAAGITTKDDSSLIAQNSFGAGDTRAGRQGMKEKSLTMPEIGLIAGTRVALGVGLGLLVSDRLKKDQRKGAGWALFGIGILTTIPLVAEVILKRPVGEKPVLLAA